MVTIGLAAFSGLPRPAGAAHNKPPRLSRTLSRTLIDPDLVISTRFAHNGVLKPRSCDGLFDMCWQYTECI